MRRLCVYCGSNAGNDPAYAAAAEELAGVLVDSGLELVYGCAHKGTMGILADAVLERGGAVHGVIPQMLEEKEVARAWHYRMVAPELEKLARSRAGKVVVAKVAKKVRTRRISTRTFRNKQRILTSGGR
mgnify:CR=1 FL=1